MHGCVAVHVHTVSFSWATLLRIHDVSRVHQLGMVRRSTVIFVAAAVNFSRWDAGVSESCSGSGDHVHVRHLKGKRVTSNYKRQDLKMAQITIGDLLTNIGEMVEQYIEQEIAARMPMFEDDALEDRIVVVSDSDGDNVDPVCGDIWDLSSQTIVGRKDLKTGEKLWFLSSEEEGGEANEEDEKDQASEPEGDSFPSPPTKRKKKTQTGEKKEPEEDTTPPPPTKRKKKTQKK